MNKDSPGMNSLAKRVPLQREGYSFGVLLEKGSEMSGLSVGGAGLHALAHALGSLDPCGVTCDDGGKYAVCLHSSSPMQLRPVQTHVPVPCAVASGKMQFENVAREWRCKWKDDGGGNAACETPVPRGGKWARTQRPAAPRTAQGCCAPRPA